MKGLFDRAFWKLFSGFILILAVSFALLAAAGVYRDSYEQFAALAHFFAGPSR